MEDGNIWQHRQRWVTAEYTAGRKRNKEGDCCFDNAKYMKAMFHSLTPTQLKFLRKEILLVLKY